MGELLDAAIAAHGGQERWRAVRSIDVTFNFFGEIDRCGAEPFFVCVPIKQVLNLDAPHAATLRNAS